MVAGGAQPQRSHYAHKGFNWNHHHKPIMIFCAILEHYASTCGHIHFLRALLQEKVWSKPNSFFPTKDGN